MPRYLINSPKPKRGNMAKRKRSAAQRAATRKMLAANRARRSSSKGGGPVAKRRRRTARRRAATASNAPRRRRRRRPATRRNPVGLLANPRRRRRSVARVSRRRRHRRNPVVSAKGIMRIITQGVQDALVITGGKAASNIIAGYIPVMIKDATGKETVVGETIRKVLAAAAVGVLATSVFKAREQTARMAVAGALVSPIEAFIKPLIAGVPVIGSALSSYPTGSRALIAGPRRIAGYTGQRPVGTGAGARTLAQTQAYYGQG